MIIIIGNNCNDVITVEDEVWTGVYSSDLESLVNNGSTLMEDFNEMYPYDEDDCLT